MTEREDQRVCIKFCLKLGHSSAETVRMIQKAFSEDAMGETQIKMWYKRFKEGRESVQSDSRPGRPSSSRNDQNIELVRSAINQDRRLTVRELEEDLGIPKTIVSEILTGDLGMKRVAAKFIPRILTQQQKDFRVQIAKDCLESCETDINFLKKIITGDESWVYGYDPETKAQSSHWKTSSSPRAKKARQSRSNVKTMLTVFFDYQGVVHYEYAPTGQTVNKEYYRDVLRRLRDAVRRKRPQMFQSGDWLIHHDNAPAHASRLVQEFLAKHQMAQVAQPPYSPDMAPCDFWLFPKLKSSLKGRRFQSVEEIKENTTNELKAIPKELFARCFEKWEHRWNKCVNSQGEYFEGD